MGIAFFDLDKTLLHRNSASAWVKTELRSGKISLRQALRGYYWIVRYGLGFAEIESVYREAIAIYAGDLEDEVRIRTEEFYKGEIRGLYRPGAREAIEEHRRAGDLLALLTSSSNYLSALVSEELSMDGYLCNRFEVTDGRFTGMPVEPMCVGDGKRVLAESWAAERDVNLANCTFYTDSISDLPAMQAFGHPVAVNPDPKLRRIASNRGWKIADWGDPYHRA